MKHVPSISFSEDSLSNKNILITGAGSGIGRAVAKIAAKNQANLILLSKDIKKLYSLQDEICHEGGNEPLIISKVFAVSAFEGSNSILFISVAKLFFVSHLSAAKAALQPLPAAVTP